MHRSSFGRTLGATLILMVFMVQGASAWEGPSSYPAFSLGLGFGGSGDYSDVLEAAYGEGNVSGFTSWIVMHAGLDIPVARGFEIGPGIRWNVSRIKYENSLGLPAADKFNTVFTLGGGGRFVVGQSSTAPYVEASVGMNFPSTDLSRIDVDGKAGFRFGAGLIAGAEYEVSFYYQSIPVDVSLEGSAKKSGNFGGIGFLFSRRLGSGGLTFAGSTKPRDTDEDGVPDREDRELNTPKGAIVNRLTGVALDSDGDGVPDGIDRHSNTPHGALVDTWGVPLDSDHDDVPDGLDRCPDTPPDLRPVDAEGCPTDGDGDGVQDGSDRCPGTPHGCTVDAQGCPHDRDGDGVCDGRDECPETAAEWQVDARGCPVEVSALEDSIADLGRFTERRILFAPGSAELLASAHGPLDQLGQALSGLPQLRFEVAGHCDDRGSDEFNQALSEARAAAVVRYLLGRHPELEPQLMARGYGKSRPVAEGVSEAARAQNRRVELVVLNPEAARQQVERKRFLRRGEKPPGDTER